RNGSLNLLSDFDINFGANGYGSACPLQSNGEMYLGINSYCDAIPYTINNFHAPNPNTIVYDTITHHVIVFNNLSAGDSVDITVTDTLGCPGYWSAIATGAPPYPASTVTTLPSCTGLNNGSMFY